MNCEEEIEPRGFPAWPEEWMHLAHPEVVVEEREFNGHLYARIASGSYQATWGGFVDMCSNWFLIKRTSKDAPFMICPKCEGTDFGVDNYGLDTTNTYCGTCGNKFNDVEYSWYEWNIESRMTKAIWLDMRRYQGSISQINLFTETKL